MKTLLLPLLFAVSPFAPAAEPIAHRVEIRNIRSEIQQTPQFAVVGIKDKPINPRYWLEIEAELEVKTTNPSGFIPEIRAQWYAIVKDKFATESGKVKLLTGEIPFQNVRTKEGRAYLIAYIGPDALETLTGKARPAASDLEAVALVISGANIVNDGRHADGLEMATAKADAKWWSSRKYETMPDLIVAKSKTPFAPLWSDRYPSEKPQ